MLCNRFAPLAWIEEKKTYLMNPPVQIGNSEAAEPIQTPIAAPTLEEVIATVDTPSIEPSSQPVSSQSWSSWFYDYTLGAAWSFYNHTLGFILNPMAISALMMIDQYRYLVEKNLLPKIESTAGAILSFFAAGTGLVGSFNAIVGTPFLKNALGIYGALGLSGTTVVVQGFLNYLNSTTSKASNTTVATSNRTKLPVWKLNILLAICTFAGACSGILARTAPTTLGNAIAESNNSSFSSAGEYGLLGAGLFLGLVNGSISALSGYQANKLFFEQILPSLINDYKTGKHKIFVPSIIFMLTCFSTLMTYSEPTAQFILGEAESEAKTRAYFETMVGLAVVNTTVVPLFFNAGYKFIKTIMEHSSEAKLSPANIFSRICTAIGLSSVFVLANYGNAQYSALDTTKSEMFSTIMGASGGIAALLPAIQSSQGVFTRMYDYFYPTKGVDEQTPLLS